MTFDEEEMFYLKPPSLYEPFYIPQWLYFVINLFMLETNFQGHFLKDENYKHLN